MSESKNNYKPLIHLAIMFFVFMIGFRFLPVVGQMTPAGMKVAGIFIGVIYGWVTVGLMLPSILGLIMIGLTGVTNTTSYFASGFGSQTVVMVTGMLIVINFVAENDLFKLITKFMLSLKIAKGKPWFTLLLFLFADYAVASVTGSLGAALLFLPLYIQMAEIVGVEKYARLNNVMITGIAFASLMGDITFPFQVTVIMVSGAFTAATGIPVDLGRYLIAVIIWAVFMISVYVGICKFVLRVDASRLANVDLTELDFDKGGATKRQVVALFFLAFTIVLLVLPNFLPVSWAVTQVLKTLGVGGCVLLALFIMSVVYVDGEPLLDIRKTAQGIYWDMIFMMAYFAPIAGLLTSDDTGIKATISMALQPILTGMSPVLIIIVIAVVGVILTNFLNNLIVAVILTSLVTILGNFLTGINLVALMALIIFICNIAFILPSGCPTNAYLYSQTELIHFKDQFLHAIIVGVIMLVITITVGLFWFSLVF